jgi:hypothetical protein
MSHRGNVLANIECRLLDRTFLQEDSPRKQGTAESLKSAVKKYEVTLLLRRAAGDHAGEGYSA